MAYSLSAVGDVPTAGVLLTATGGTAGKLVYLFRRDAEGVRPVRAAVDGLTWPSSGNLTATDWEAQQGTTVDYLLTDVDGALLASAVGVVVPLWGTWLRDPYTPSRSVKVSLTVVGPVEYPARRAVVPIEGSARSVVLSAVRSAAAGELVVSALDAATVQGVRDLLADGLPILVDVPAAWGVPYRWVSVGDVQVSRPLAVDGSLGLDAEARTFTLAGVVEVDQPVGGLQPETGWTYAAVPTLYSTYAALAASFTDYTDLAGGPDA